MTTFVRDDLALPDGKSDARPISGPANKNYTAAEWNLLCEYLDDVRTEIQRSPGYLNVKAFGATGDGVTDDWGAFNDAIESIAVGVTEGTSLFVPVGVYRLSRPLHIKRPLKLFGGHGMSQVGTGNEGATVLKFDAGVHGVIVHRSATSSDGGSGENSVIEDLVIRAASKSGSSARGLTCFATAYLTRVMVESFPSHGIAVLAASDMNAPHAFNTVWSALATIKEGDVRQHLSTGGGDPDNNRRYIAVQGGTTAASLGPSGTGSSITDGSVIWKYVSGCFANVGKIQSCRSSTNSGHGFLFEGDNANAWSVEACDASSNGEWGYLDNSFLGNTYTACHAATNGDNGPRNGSVTAWAPSTAYAVGAYRLNGGRKYKCVTAGTSAGSGGPTTTSTTTAETDGSCQWRYVAYLPGPFGAELDEYGNSNGNIGNAHTQWLGCYSEADQAPSVGVYPAFYVGGIHAADFVGSVGSVRGGNTGAYGASLRLSGTRWEVLGDGSDADWYFVAGNNGIGDTGSFLAFMPPDATIYHYLKHTQNFLGKNWFCANYGNVPLYTGWGWAADGARVSDALTSAQRAVPPTTFAASQYSGFLIGNQKIVSVSAAPGSSAGPYGQGTYWDFFVGDIAWNRGATAGGYAGWVCVGAGTAGTYTEGRTATTDGTTAVVLNSASAVLNVGNYVTINGTTVRITAISGVNVTVSATIAAASGVAIAYSNPTWSEFGAATGGAGNSTASPGNATLNTRSGRSAIALGASAVTITNSRVTSSSIVHASLQTVDGTLTQILTVVPGSGSFVITGNANATGNVNVCWSIVE